MINGVEGLFKIDENYTIDEAIVNINRPNVCIQQQLLRIQTGRRQANWLFTSAAEKLNQGLPGTN